MNTKGLSFILTCLALAATWAIVGYAERNPPQALVRPLYDIPTEIAGWKGKDDPPQATRILLSLDATALLSRTYRKEGSELGLFVAYYAKQKAGESMHSPKYCLPGGGWEPLETTFVTIRTALGEASINKYVIQKDGAKSLVLYWYQSPRRIVASEYAGKALLFWDGLIHRRQGGSIVRLTMPATPEGLEDGLLVAPAVIAEVQRCLGG
jgi:EpsI family protein